MNNNTLLLVAALGAVFLMSRKASAATPAAAAASPLATSNNVNNQLWSAVLGGAWRSLVSPGSAGNSGFLMRNDFGQVVTSDGKPVNSVFSDLSNAISTGGYSDVDVSAPDGTDYLSLLGW